MFLFFLQPFTGLEFFLKINLVSNFFIVYICRAKKNQRDYNSEKNFFNKGGIR